MPPKPTGVHRVTIYRWMKTCKPFSAALHRARAEFVLARRDDLYHLSNRALETLLAVLDNPTSSPAVLLRTAMFILQRPQLPNTGWSMPEPAPDPDGKKLLDSAIIEQDYDSLPGLCNIERDIQTDDPASAESAAPAETPSETETPVDSATSEPPPPPESPVPPPADVNECRRGRHECPRHIGRNEPQRTMQGRRHRHRLPCIFCTIIVFTMRVLTGCAASLALIVPLLLAQPPQPQPPPKEPTEKEKEEVDSGIPISSELVKKSCSPCHKADEKGRLSRISWRRTTPEGWEFTIKRMVSLNGLEIQPADAREVLKYLATNLGLAPEEARAAAFEPEKRMIDYKYSDKDVEGVCTKCHSMGRVVSQRRSESEWKLLIAMHRGYYPLSDFQAFRRGGPPQTQPGPDGRPPDNRHPMDKVIPKLAEQLALKTPEWSASLGITLS